ncbi:NAD-dependent epimerase/dehydratase family protein [Gimesia maris]|jgi:CDP-paratose 2-epimerase|uniref:CDP-paratose 2-epimerase n=1 Tax=Gimesia maris TaxID=122 RepID=A0A3D3RGV9_9PLAN|nr:NAD-dependent epimerase/dehydratase family protein [Gimesia maris]MAC51170.1 NAD-dependent epimerase [Gimesia sp.]QDT80987.1 CDP-paratose 2-epimerase [Gimesia maris]QDU16707.1 CDP-paratose 2-epimerase [Gimesia maris]QEG18752.1 CDP-paratose 2-epimerase [Gimesia maris]QGQ32568.1 NAD-dependent epimerase/dehydratase family protein [Gimesia maris]|tara:strand:- start:89646 stop:90686 length:1041 start_codon:yes stop_codon:yes gene_type:complete
MLVTGSSGLIGSEAVTYFDQRGWEVVGVDNNMRAEFFGQAGDTSWSLKRLLDSTKNFRHLNLDIRNVDSIMELYQTEKFDATVHCAAQPSHDKARDFPLTDFSVNAVGTINLLEANRLHSLESPFVTMSTNKVYGDAPNEIKLKELETRWEYDDPAYANGIDESMRIDASKHSIFGASKVAADVMVQEYGRYFDMPTCCLRGGCLTGPNHSGVELHGFLSFLVNCNLQEREYTVFGYKGKQVRDNIHSLDVIRFIEQFIDKPRSAAVYNIGGGKQNSLSILDAFDRVSQLTGKEMRWKYSDENRSGDHICYYSNLDHMKSDYPEWGITKSLDDIFSEVVQSWEQRV